MGRTALMWGLVFVLASACGGTGSSALFGDGGDSGGNPRSDSGTPKGDSSGGSSGAHDSSGVSTDAPADTGGQDAPPPDAGCPSFCAAHAPPGATCSDFDESSAVPSVWTVATTDGGKVSVSNAEAFSCTSSLMASLPMETSMGMGGGPPPEATATVPFKLTGSTVILDLEVYLPSNDTKSFVGFFGIKLGDGDTIALEHHGDPFWFVSNAPSFSINAGLMPSPLAGAWNHMTMTVVVSGSSSGSVTLDYEGDDHAPHTATYNGPTLSNGAPSDGLAVIGMVAAGGTEAPFVAYYDNVIVRVGM